ncbi:MAG: GDSL-type esterase/lipase family protein [Deltaproteobacteria bacterium]|jgi:phospholipase/lecithinase/hemolysin|nr:GDSL-type esterase/lipase family protein [Deltaproteobacteria bacterium]
MTNPYLPKTLESPFSVVISFGDSYSDNSFINGHGFKRYTNTWTWVEYLSQMLGLPHDNWAFGGAMSDERLRSQPPGPDWGGLFWQIEEFLKERPDDDVMGTTLFTVMIGANDRSGGQSDGLVTAKNIVRALERLVQAGARTILYREGPTALLPPWFQTKEADGFREGWIAQINLANQETRRLVKKDFAAEHPEVKLYYLQTDPLFLKIKNQEPGFKFENLDDPWDGTHVFPKPYLYMWWDEFHPMGQVHLLLAEETAAAIREDLCGSR